MVGWPRVLLKKIVVRVHFQLCIIEYMTSGLPFQFSIEYGFTVGGPTSALPTESSIRGITVLKVL